MTKDCHVNGRAVWLEVRSPNDLTPRTFTMSGAFSPRPGPPRPATVPTGTYVDNLRTHCSCKKFSFPTEAAARAAADDVQARTKVPYDVYRCSGNNVWHTTTKDAGPGSLRTRARRAAWYLYHRASDGITLVDLYDLCRIGTPDFDRPSVFRRAVNILYDLRLIRLAPNDPTRVIVNHPDRMKRFYCVGEGTYRHERGLIDAPARDRTPFNTAYELVKERAAQLQQERHAAGDPFLTEVVRETSLILLTRGSMFRRELQGSSSRKEFGKWILFSYLKAGWAARSAHNADKDELISVVRPDAIRAFLAGTGPAPWEAQVRQKGTDLGVD